MTDRETTITGGPEGSGPLRWMLTLMKEEPANVQDQVSSLLREGLAVHEEAENLCFEALAALLDRLDVDADEETITVLAAQFLDAASASRSLLAQGRVRACMSQIRAMVESFAVMLYVRGQPERAHAWHDAQSAPERREFSFGQIKDEIAEGEHWKGVWDLCNEVVHTNRGAMPAQMRPRLVEGFDLYVGPFFDPGPLAGFFGLSFLVVLRLAESIGEWYTNELALPKDYHARLQGLIAGYQEFESELSQRAQEFEAKLKESYGALDLREQLWARLYLDARYDAWRRSIEESVAASDRPTGASEGST